MAQKKTETRPAEAGDWFTDITFFLVTGSYIRALYFVCQLTIFKSVYQILTDNCACFNSDTIVVVLDFFRPIPKKRTVKNLKKSGVIYNNPGTIGKTLFHLGNILLLGSVVYAVYLYFPLTTAVVAYWQIETSEPIPVTPTTPPLPNVTVTVTPTPVNVNVGTTEYSIFIPKIGAKATIVKNVSPFDQKEYSKILKDNVVAQAKGSYDVDKGKGKSTFVFAHSTEQGISMVRQNSIFYLLGELKNGETVEINNGGNKITYRVYMQKIVNASQIEYLKYSEDDREVLVLQTCWPIGTDWKRLLVFAERVL